MVRDKFQKKAAPKTADREKAGSRAEGGRQAKRKQQEKGSREPKAAENAEGRPERPKEEVQHYRGIQSAVQQAREADAARRRP